MGGTEDNFVDVLRGGAGDDTYEVRDSFTYNLDQIVELPGEGTDTVLVYFGAMDEYTMQTNIENLTVASSLYTGTIIGNALDNVISGPTNVGPTIIDGGAGADTMIDRSGLGATFHVDNSADRVVGSVGNVVSSIDWTLGAGLSNLTLIGSNAISGVGNVGNNRLDGRSNTAANVLTVGSETILM